MITDIAGVRVGHWTNSAAETGCTVVLFPEGTVASGEVRGGAPATREFALLDPTRMVQRLDADELERLEDGLIAACHHARVPVDRVRRLTNPAAPSVGTRGLVRARD